MALVSSHGRAPSSVISATSPNKPAATPAMRNARVNTAARIILRPEKEKKTPRGCCQRTWEFIKSIPIIGHLLRAVIWAIKTVSAWVFGSPRASSEEGLGRFINDIDARRKVLSKGINNWKVENFSDLIRLSALHTEIDVLSDSLYAYRQQYEGASRSKQTYHLSKAQDLSKEYEGLKQDLKEIIKQNLDKVKAQLDQIQKDILSRADSLEKSRLSTDDDTHDFRSTQLLLLYTCDNYLRSCQSLFQLEFIDEQDPAHQKVFEISCALRKELGFKGRLPSAWANHIAHGGSDLTLSIDEVGIPNIGNSCYMNSSLQMLFGISKFGTLLQQTLRRDRNESDRSYKNRCKLQKSLYGVVKAIKSRDTDSIRKAMITLRLALFYSGFHSDFQPKDMLNQQDAPTFISVIFRELGKVVDWRQTRTFQHEGVDHQRDGVIDPQPIVGVSIRDEDMKLKDLIAKEFSDEPIDDDQQAIRVNIEGSDYQISQYNSKAQITGIIPDFLPIQIKRMNADGSKNSKPVPCSLDSIDLTDIFDPKIIGEGQRPLLYQVFSFQVHHGESAENGHYTAYGLCPDGKWRHYNDHLVTEVTVEEVEQEIQHAYSLMLVRV